MNKQTSEASSITDETSDFIYNPNTGLFRAYSSIVFYDSERFAALNKIKYPDSRSFGVPGHSFLIEISHYTYIFDYIIR